jgi:hypothetical protein
VSRLDESFERVETWDRDDDFAEPEVNADETG